MLGMILLLVAFPNIATWLPTLFIIDKELAPDFIKKLGLIFMIELNLLRYGANLVSD